LHARILLLEITSSEHLSNYFSIENMSIFISDIKSELAHARNEDSRLCWPPPINYLWR